MSHSSTLAKNSSPDGAFHGPERRRHRVYVTRNTEYHFRDGFCVAVRDRRTGSFLRSHLALRRRIHGGLRFYVNGGILPNPGDPEPGEALYFTRERRTAFEGNRRRLSRASQVRRFANDPMGLR